MKTLHSLLSGGMLSLRVPAHCSELFLCEYDESSMNNKYTEIFNRTKSTVALSDYAIVRLNAGQTNPDILGFSV